MTQTSAKPEVIKPDAYFPPPPKPPPPPPKPRREIIDVKSTIKKTGDK